MNHVKGGKKGQFKTIQTSHFNRPMQDFPSRTTHPMVQIRNSAPPRCPHANPMEAICAGLILLLIRELPLPKAMAIVHLVSFLEGSSNFAELSKSLHLSCIGFEERFFLHRVGSPVERWRVPATKERRKSALTKRNSEAMQAMPSG
jgi:hypothetical protein